MITREVIEIFFGGGGGGWWWLLLQVRELCMFCFIHTQLIQPQSTRPKLSLVFRLRETQITNFNCNGILVRDRVGLYYYCGIASLVFYYTDFDDSFIVSYTSH